MSVSRMPRAVECVFLESFSASDVAEPLASFDSSTSCTDVRAFMQARDFDIVGIRDLAGCRIALGGPASSADSNRVGAAALGCPGELR